MSILILNSFRAKHIPYGNWLSETKEKLFFLCSDDHDLKNHSYYYANSFSNYEENSDVEKKAAEIIEKNNIKTIIAKSECDLLRAGKLRDQFNIPGQTYEQALAFRDKVVMKTHLSKTSIKIPLFKRLQNKQEAIEFAKAHGFPLILKPVDGAGSINVTVLNNDAHLQRMHESGFRDMEIETFVEGKMYHVDGIVINHEIKFIYPSRYLTSCLNEKNLGPLSSAIIDYSDPLRSRLIDFTKAILAALPTPANTTFHAEVFHTPEDELVFCEIASRTGGARVRETMMSAFDVDLDQLWIQSQVNIQKNISYPEKPSILSAWMLMSPQKGKLIHLPDMQFPEWVFDYRKSGVIEKQYADATKRTDAIASFVVRGENQTEIQERLKYLENWFNSHVIWE